jgi:endonuclease/exonuclease/phosphatase family metal-dependent hydrolase
MEAPAASDLKKPATRKRRRGSRLAAIVCWLCLFAMLGLIYYLRTQGDRAWLPTILIFSPRWIFAAPVVLLLPLYRNCRVPCVLLVLTAVFPLMGFCVGWHRLVPAQNASSGDESIRIVTFNLHHIPFDEPAFRDFLARAHADVLAFEEMPAHANRGQFPEDLKHITYHGELCIAARYPIRAAMVLSPDTVVRYTLQTPAGPVDLIGVHLSSPHWALRDSIEGSTQGPDELARNIANRAAEASLLQHEIGQTTGRPLIIAGDFNLAPDSPLFTGSFPGMSDAFESTGLGFGWTYFHQHTMVRIDHVLTNNLLQCRACRVGPNLGSPHRPVIADLVLRHP